MTALFAAAAFAGGTTAAVATPTGPAAVAAPSNCGVTAGGYWVTAYCAGGSGEFRAYTRCDEPLWPDYNRYGPWVRAGSGAESTAICSAYDRAFNYGVQVR
ncbi:hypothetical protein ACWED2_16935 [Amycolatopsis sp. NPDC005003]